MAKVTALEPERRGRVRVELDGAAWRTIPAAAVVSAGLALGCELDRSRARELGRALRRSRALDAAGRALSRRDRSPAGLAAVLEQRGVAPAQRDDAVATFERLGFVDAERFALSRAAALAVRGYGDEGIRFELEREGVVPELVEAAVGALEPELERARALAARAGGGVKAARRLVAKGFPADVAATAAGLDDEE